MLNCFGEIIFEASRDRNVYTIELNDLFNQNVKCLSALDQVT